MHVKLLKSKALLNLKNLHSKKKKKSWRSPEAPLVSMWQKACILRFPLPYSTGTSGKRPLFFPCNFSKTNYSASRPLVGQKKTKKGVEVVLWAGRVQREKDSWTGDNQSRVREGKQQPSMCSLCCRSQEG